MLANKGVTKEGIRILSEESVKEMLTWRYQFSGSKSGPNNDFHNYGLGLYGTTFRKNDRIIGH